MPNLKPIMQALQPCGPHPGEPIEHLWERLHKVRHIATARGDPISDQTILDLTFLLFESTGTFTMACDMWRTRPTTNKTFPELCLYFNSENNYHLRKLTPSWVPWRQCRNCCWHHFPFCCCQTSANRAYHAYCQCHHQRWQCHVLLLDAWTRIQQNPHKCHLFQSRNRSLSQCHCQEHARWEQHHHVQPPQAQIGYSKTCSAHTSCDQD